MTAEIEKRIVEMRFENEQFEKAAGQTLTTLGKLDRILDVLGEAGADQLVRTLDTVQYRFSSFGIAAASVIENVTGKVISLTTSLLSAIPEKIISGGINRAFNLEDAEFRLKGLGVAWENIEDDLDYAVKDTAYGLDEAAQAASILAAGNINWKNNVEGASDMAHALRAISGVAAMTGSSYSDIAAVLTDVAAAGRLTGDVITRMSYRGMNLTAALAKSMGKSEKEIKEMLEEGKLSVQEFYLAMDKAFGEHATKANETYSGSLMNINAALSRIGADFITPLHKNLIPINNALRLMFNRMRDVTKPFAEGQFTSFLESMKKKLLPIIENFKFDWLEKALNLFGKFLSLIDRVTDKVIAFVKSFKELFTAKHELEDTLEDGNPQFWINSRAQERMEKLKNIFHGLKRAVQMTRDTIRAFGKAINHLTGGIFTDFIDHILSAGDALSRFFRENEGSAWKKISDFMGWVEKAAISLHDTLAKAMVAVWTILSKTYTFLRDTGVFKFFADVAGWAFGKLGDILLWVSGKLGEFFASLTDIINHGGNASSILGLIGEGFKGIGDILGGIFGHLRDFLKLLFGLEENESVFDHFATMVRNAGKTIRENFETMRKNLDETLGKGGVGTEAIKIAAALLSVLLGYRKVENASWALGRLERALEFLGKIFEEGYKALKNFNPAQWADDIETLLRRVSGALRAFSDNLNAKSLLYIAGAVIGLAFGLMMLSSIVETGHLTSALRGLAATMGILVGAIFAMKKILGSTSFGNTWVGFFKILQKGLAKFMDAFTLKEAASAMIFIAASVLILVVAIGALAYIIKNTDPKTLVIAIGIIVGGVALLIGALALLNHIFKDSSMLDTTKFIAVGIGMVMMAVAVGILALAIWGLSKIPWKELWPGIVGVAAALVFLVAAVIALSKWAADPMVIFAAAAMIAVAAAILVLAVAVAIFSVAIAMFGWDGLIAMVVTLVAVTAALALLSGIALPVLGVAAALLVAGIAMIAFAAAMLIFAVAMYIVGAIDWENITNHLNTFLIVIGVMIGVITMLGALGPIALIGAGVILMIGLAIAAAASGFAALNMTLVNLAVGLNMLDGLDLVMIGKGLKEVGKGMKKVAGAAFKFNFGNAEAFTYFPSLAAGLVLLADLDLEKLSDKKTGLPALANALKAFGGLTGTGMSLIWGDGGLLAAGPAFTSLAGGLRDLTPALTAFSNLRDPEATCNQIRDLVTAINSFAHWDNKSKGNMQTATASLEKISNALANITPARVATFNNFSNVFSNIKIDNAQSVKDMAVYMGELVTTMEAFGNTFVAHGESISLLIWKGIKQGYDERLYYGFQDVLDGLSNAMGTFNASGVWITHGRNIAVGIANGISRNADVAQRALNQLALQLQRTFTVQLRIASPSRVFESLAEYIPAGIARGIQNGQTEVTNAMVSTMSGALGYLEEVGNDSSNLSPRITPVMDLNRMRAEYGQADQIFRNSGISSFGGINGINVNGDAINYNMQNKDVVQAIQDMGDRINRLGSAIEQMKLVMDTGMVVGALAPQMNNQLGVMAVREVRQ